MFVSLLLKSSKFSICLVVICFAALLTACNGGSDVSSLPTGNADAGKELFQNGTGDLQACITCHSVDGAPEAGPTLQGIASRAATRISGTSAASYLLASIQRPNEYVVSGFSAGLMPSYAALKAQQQADLLTYLLTLK